MDTVKQAVAGIVGSVLLAGCLNQSNVLDIAADAQTEDGDQDGEMAAAWPATPLSQPGAMLETDRPPDWWDSAVVLGDAPLRTQQVYISVCECPRRLKPAARGASGADRFPNRTPHGALT